MIRVLITGASGLVGGELLRLLQTEPQITSIVAPTRLRLPAHEKLQNPVNDELSKALSELVQPVDVVFCCLGTTRHQAGSAKAFRYVDYQLVIETALAGQRLGAQHCLAVSAMAANPDSLFLYNRTKGQMEQALREQHWPCLTLVRPSMLVGARSEPRWLERLALPLFTLLPDKWKSIAASEVAGRLLTEALNQKQGIQVLTSDQLPGSCSRS